VEETLLPLVSEVGAARSGLWCSCRTRLGAVEVRPLESQARAWE
jgi:hypothetical protein